MNACGMRTGYLTRTICLMIAQLVQELHMWPVTSLNSRGAARLGGVSADVVQTETNRESISKA